VIVVPAVDIRDGRCVRLRQGRDDARTVFSDDPVAMAVRWASLGARRLHVVDLDGAFAGEPRQAPLIAALVRAVAPVPVQVGGGLRDRAAVDAVLAAGAGWAVVGTRAALDPAFLAEICRAHPGRVIVAVDGRGDRVAVKGWTAVADEPVVGVGRRARDAGAAGLLYTDVSRDGMGVGPNVDDTARLARLTGLPVLASGGVGTLEHLAQLMAIPALAGVIVGRALYTGTLDLPAALALAGAAPAPAAGSGAGPHQLR
jgi:phosphoribosylformimino-5-aminoimidazole carboxamide ribotide isomerase